MRWGPFFHLLEEFYFDLKLSIPSPPCGQSMNCKQRMFRALPVDHRRNFSNCKNKTRVEC